MDGHVKLKERVKEIRETNRYRLTLSGPMVLALLYLAVNNCGVKPFLLGDLLRAAADGWLRPLICRIETLHADQYILYSNQSRHLVVCGDRIVSFFMFPNSSTDESP